MRGLCSLSRASRPARVGFVGCGAIALHHLDAIDAVNGMGLFPPFEVTAIADSNPQACETISSRVQGAKVYRSLEEMLDKSRQDIDAVALLLPHDLHVDSALKSFEAGLHVLLEKPMARTVSECQQILKAAKRAPDKVFMVAENSQYWPEVVLVKSLLESNAIGQVVTASSHYYETVSVSQITSESDQGSPDEKAEAWLGWRRSMDRMGGGVVVDGGQHWIRPLRCWLGDVEAVVGTTGRPLAEMEGESLANALLRFESGVTAVFRATVLRDSFMADPRCPWFHVTGTEGEIVVGGGFDGGIYLYNKDHPKGSSNLLVGQRSGYFNSFPGVWEEFGNALHGVQALENTPEYSLGDLKTALALYKSAESNSWVRLSEL